MAADELRRRVQASIGGRFGPTEHAVATRAGIKPQVLNLFLKTPSRGVDADTAKKLAKHFGWTEAAVFRWADLPLPAELAAPVAQWNTALTAGEWPPAVREALYTLAQATAPPVISEPSPQALQAAVETAARQALGPLAAKEGKLSAEEIHTIIVGDFLRYLGEELRGRGRPAPAPSGAC